MAKPYKLPLVQKDASGNLQRATSTNENYLAYQAGLRFAERGLQTPTAIRKTAYFQADSAIGSFTDTFYNEAVGTHPGSSLSTGSTTTTLYQVQDSDGNNALDNQSSGLFRRPVYESDGNIFDMDSSAMDGVGSALLSIIVSNEYPGAQRLASSAPSGDWAVSVSSAFSDTTTDGNVTTYNIYERQTMTAPSKCNAMHVRRSSYGAYPLAAYNGGLEAMTDSEMSLTFGQICARFFRHGEIGTYELRSSAQGAPTRTGTWVSRGTAIDTRYTTANQQYADPNQYSQQFTSSQFAGTRTYASQYSGSRNFAANYIGNRDFIGAGQFAGSRLYLLPGQFAGTRPTPANFAGTRDFVGTRQFAGTRPTPANFIGERSFVGERTFAGTRNTAPGQFAGTRPTPAQFTGNRPSPAQFSGFRDTPAQFAGNRPTPGNFVGERNFLGDRTFAGFRETAGNFIGARNRPSEVYYVGPRQSYFTGNRAVGYLGTRGFSAYYVSTVFYPQNFSGSTPGTFAGTVNYAGNRATPGQFTGPRQFAGTRATPNQQIFAQGPYGGFYAGSRQVPGQFAGNRQFSGNRSMPGQFAGTVNYVGTRTVNYAGTRGYTGSYLGARYYSSYFVGTVSGDFLGPRNYDFLGPINYLGERTFAGNRPTPANFVGGRNFLGDRTFAGTRNTAPGQFAGTRPSPGTFAGFRETPGTFAGFRDTPAQFAGNRPTPGNFVGARTFVGDRTFAGDRQTPGIFSGDRPFTSDPIAFGGDRQTPGQFAGTRQSYYSAQYAGNRTFVGERTFAGSRNYASQFAGSRTYSGNYTTQYTGQFTTLYTGETLTNTSTTIETYTLYVRVA